MNHASTCIYGLRILIKNARARVQLLITRLSEIRWDTSKYWDCRYCDVKFLVAQTQGLSNFGFPHNMVHTHHYNQQVQTY